METLVLSRRNLQSLLNKLDRNKISEGSSACSIVKYKERTPQNTMDECLVIAEEDKVVYKEYPAGYVYPVDDPSLRKREC